jgi:hypothetical protein
MLAENLHRQDLTAVEEADGYAQLAAFDWTAEQIAARVGRKTDRVRHGLAVAPLPNKIRPKVADGEWTLEQAAGVEEFVEDEKALARLAKATGSYLHYALADERARRDRRNWASETRQRLADQGVRVITKPKDFPWSSVAVSLDQLTDEQDRRLTPGKHRRCLAMPPSSTPTAPRSSCASIPRTTPTKLRPSIGTRPVRRPRPRARKRRPASSSSRTGQSRPKLASRSCANTSPGAGRPRRIAPDRHDAVVRVRRLPHAGPRRGGRPARPDSRERERCPGADCGEDGRDPAPAVDARLRRRLRREQP